MKVIHEIQEKGYKTIAIGNFGSIILSADGKFLYASNRAHNSIAVFKVVADGSLELIEIVPTQGLNPRDFTLSPDQNHLISAHQDSPNATVFKRDSASGKLTLLSDDFYVPEAVCGIELRRQSAHRPLP